jgi:ribose 1,5-bisphosphokinase PhnN
LLKLAPVHKAMNACGEFERFQEVTSSLVMSVCLSARPPVLTERLGFHWRDFHEIWCMRISRKYVVKIQDLLKAVKNNGYFE